jgi:hypothetical protein
MFRKKTLDPEPGLWIVRDDLPATPANTFYSRLDTALESMGFSEAIRKAAAPYYEMDASQGGAPGIDPAVAFKMWMVGFFEDIRSERGIIARCSDSLSIRSWRIGRSSCERGGRPRVSEGRRHYGSAARRWSGASTTFWTRAEVGGRHFAVAQTSRSGTSSERPAPTCHSCCVVLVYLGRCGRHGPQN